MSEINVVSRTQHIFVDPASSAVSIINAGPIGPAGPNSIPAGGTSGQVWQNFQTMIMMWGG